MEAQQMFVDPNELVIDMPLSDQVLQRLLPSVARDGVMQPVFVWLEDMRIIDGFHRTEAARRCNLATIPVNVVDCNEEQFWNYRIISARTHYEIEASRLAAWMVECWKQTKWYVPLVPDEQGLMPIAFNRTKVDLRMIEMVWKVFRIKRAPGYRMSAQGALDADEEALIAWIDARAAQWGMSPSGLADNLLAAWGLRDGFADSRGDDFTYDEWAQKYNLNLRQRTRLQNEIMIKPGRYSAPSMEIAEAYIEAKIVPDLDAGGNYSTFAARKQAEIRELEKKENEERARKEKERQSDPAYQRFLLEKTRKEATRHSISILNDIKDHIQRLEQDLTLAPDGNTILSSFLWDVVKVYHRLWPNQATPQIVPKVQAENIRLQRENAALKTEIESLKRALGSKKRTKVTSNQVVISSGEVDRLPT